MAFGILKTKLCRTVRMRCALRYIVCVIIAVLMIISINLSVLSNRASDLFLTKTLRDSRHNAVGNGIHKRNIGKDLIAKIVKDSTLEQIILQHGGHVVVTWDQCRRNPNTKTGNTLIDEYGQNDLMRSGEVGRGVTFVGDEKERVTQLVKQYNLNVYASDIIPLNRIVPDSRFSGCKEIPFAENLPSTSIIIPFYDEWPSVLLRTIYSIVNRTPWSLLQEIILVDDGSTAEYVGKNLDAYLDTHFPAGLIRIIRLPKRVGLIQARLTGFRNATGDVIIFFDSHMEVNIDWLQPLLTELKADRKTVAMGVLDYIQLDTFEYKFYGDYMTRYGFDWRLVFFETFFRGDQVGENTEDPRQGTVMVGAAYAIYRDYFAEMGSYDEGMKVWGGENLEMAWRIWLCGGRLVHVPCSHIGHVARAQPYTFPGGRTAVEQYNYKRAVEVWMEEPHKHLIYDYFPQMKDMDVGDLSARFALKKSLNCKPFSWFMQNIWPELFVLSQNVTAWGSARNLNTNKCLDNHQYLFQAAEPLFLDPCHYQLATQGFSLTKDKRLRTSLQCVVVKANVEGTRPMLEDCIIGPKDTWIHTQGGYLKHEQSGLCLDVDESGPVMKTCNPQVITQVWQFNTYVP